MVGLVCRRPAAREVARKGHPARGEQHRAHVGQHVAEEIRRGDHVERLRLLDEPVGREIDVDEGRLDSGARGRLLAEIAPERADRWDAAFLDHDGELSPASRGERRRHVEETPHLAFGVSEGVLRDTPVPWMRDVAPVPLVDAARVLPNDQHVGAGHAGGLEPPGLAERGDRLQGRELAEEVEPAAHVVHEAPPARPAEDRAAVGEDPIAEGRDLLGQRAARHELGFAPDRAARPDLEVRPGRSRRGENLERRADDLGAYPLAGENAHDQASLAPPVARRPEDRVGPAPRAADLARIDRQPFPLLGQCTSDLYGRPGA